MIAIYKRELKSFICNMTGAVFIAFVLLMTGIYMTVLHFKGGYPQFERMLSNVTFIFFLVVPILTMRSVAEEKSNKTDQLLYSLPVGMTSVVIGKYLAMVTVHLSTVAVMATYPLVLRLYGSVNLASAYSALLAFFLLGCALIAIGMFISSLTESQVLAAVISFACFLIMYLLTPLSGLIAPTAAASLFCLILCAMIVGLIVYATVRNSLVSLSVSAVLILALICVYLIVPEPFAGMFPKILASLALFNRMGLFTGYQIFDVTAIIYYISAILLFVYFTVQSMEKKRWI